MEPRKSGRDAANKSEEKGLRRAHTVSQTGNPPQRGPSQRTARLRANSLRRLNNNNEPVRKHSREPSSPVATDGSTSSSRPDAREGRYFTVGNVGHNGKIYLRPATNPRQSLPQTGALGHSGIPGSGSGSENRDHDMLRDESRDSIWSSSQLSDFRPAPIREDSAEHRPPMLHESPPPDQQDKRRRSFSDIDEQLPSSTSRSRRDLKIVVDNAEGESSAAPTSAGHALGLPIPHHRLGGSRFSPEGAPAFRSSAQTRATVSDNPQGLSTRRRSNDQVSTQTHSLVFPVFPVSRSLSGFTTAPAHSSVFYRLKEPIEPAIFDVLSHQMDNASVVRYLAGTNQITAATPARIVAQITSDSFMDYELVSDFFLTFRSYLSLSNLLSLLLARLQWAIDRSEEDGRIIRIRAFAALRHWILNYFVDDFAVKRELRVQFCDQINRMYEDVKSREGKKASDLKIIIDLKRCWNGRYALYWDDPDSLNDNNPDTPVHPGGNERSVGSSSTQDSTPFPTKPTRRESMHSSRGAKRFGSGSAPAGRRSSTSGKPAWNRSFHSHKRSGSFSDSFRDDRAPLPNAEGHGLLNLQTGDYSESIIRGNVYVPLEPTVGILAPPSPNFEIDHLDFRSGGDPGKDADSAAKKNFITSIRKALHTRQAGSHGGTPPSPPHATGRTSTLPSNVALGSEAHRNKRSESHDQRSRSDVLGETTLRSYQNLLVSVSRDSHPSTDSNRSKSDRDSKNIFPDTSKLAVFPKNQQESARMPSQMMTGSKSAFVVNDTRTNPPMMSGALSPSAPVDASNPNRASNALPSPTSDSIPSPKTHKPRSKSPVGAKHERELPSKEPELAKSPILMNPRQSSGPHRSSSLPRSSPRPATITSLSDRLRKYTMSQHVSPEASTSKPDNSSVRGSTSRKSSLRKSMNPLTRMLRRRPGGDLRKMQNAEHLKSHHSTASFASTRSGAETDEESVISKNTEEQGRDSEDRPSSAPLRAPYSLLEDSSSRPMRPSFEAAVAGFSEIPDDHDGGIESTLRKLEGAWEDTTSQPPEGGQRLKKSGLRHVETSSSEEQAHQRRQLEPERDYHPTWSVPSGAKKINTSSHIPSESSYCSIPLLERGLSDQSVKSQTLRSPESDATISHPLPHQGGKHGSAHVERSRSSTHGIKKPPGRGQIRDSTRSNRPNPPDAGDPKIEDDVSSDEEVSEISSEVSGADDGDEAPTHPLVHPPSPPRAKQSLDLMSAGRTRDDTQPLSRGSTHTAKDRQPSTDKPPEAGQPHGPRASLVVPIQEILSMASNHVPFILAHDSKTLAQQFTVIEQAALSEVDWRDLVEMRWSDASQSTLNWVEYLAEDERRGIDIAVARFNLMVKWAISEIVLTQHAAERAHAITKLIHVAVHARKLCNYATMLQVTIALSSVDCTRLVKTWELVPEGEKRLLKDMEPLVQPVRNFHKLRMEMETSTLQNGCIPFVGLYVQDLTYNSQKPAQIASTREADPLVNFERYRTTATIVKSLLRLIDASTKYSFEPVHGVVEHCLWISALPDEKILALSKSLE